MQAEPQELWTIATTIRLGIAFVASTWLSVPIAVKTLLLLMAFDIITGLIAAASEGTLNSHRSWLGLRKKVLTLLLIGAVSQIIKPLNIGFDLMSAVAVFYVINETISIIENCDRSGVPIPSALLDMMLKAKGLTGRDRTAVEDLKARQEGESDRLAVIHSRQRRAIEIDQEKKDGQ